MMKKIFAAIFFVSLLTLIPVGRAEELNIDTLHSTIGFSVPILGGLSKVRGKFSEFTATVSYDEKDVTKSSVSAVIKAASIDTGIARRDNHLKTADFFDVEKYPEITFQSSRVEKRGKQLLAYGTFTMHGVSKEIVLPITVTGKLVDPATKQTSYGFASTLKLNRLDYGVSYQNKDNASFLGNEVEIELFILSRPPQPKKS
jgi:polyisoprenoid-binding protein YceI